MNTPNLPSDAKTLKLAALIALGLFGVLSWLAMLQRHIQPEREQRIRGSGSQEIFRRSIPPEVEREFQKTFKEK